MELQCPHCGRTNRLRTDYEMYAKSSGKVPVCKVCKKQLVSWLTAKLSHTPVVSSGSTAEPFTAGDHLRIRRYHASGVSFDHHGIYIGNHQVIEYDGPDSGGLIQLVSLEEFGQSGEEIARVPSERDVSREKVVARAWERLKEKEYNLVFNNCEHFAYWCRTGKARSVQVENTAVVVSSPLGGLIKIISDKIDGTIG